MQDTMEYLHNGRSQTKDTYKKYMIHIIYTESTDNENDVHSIRQGMIVQFCPLDYTGIDRSTVMWTAMLHESTSDHIRIN